MTSSLPGIVEGGQSDPDAPATPAIPYAPVAQPAEHTLKDNGASCLSSLLRGWCFNVSSRLALLALLAELCSISNASLGWREGKKKKALRGREEKEKTIRATSPFSTCLRSQAQPQPHAEPHSSTIVGCKWIKDRLKKIGGKIVSYHTDFPSEQHN